MALKRRSSHMDGCTFIFITVVILMVGSTPVLENHTNLVVNSPIERNNLDSTMLSETSQHKAETLKQLPKLLDDISEDYSSESSEEDQINKIEKKYTTKLPPEIKLSKLFKRSEEKVEGTTEKNKTEKSKEVVANVAKKQDDNAVVKFDEKREEKDEDKEDDDDSWGVKSIENPTVNESIEKEAENNGIVAVKGPYQNISETLETDDSSNKHDHVHTFRNWQEYLNAQKGMIRKAFSNEAKGGKGHQQESLRKPVHRPLIQSDDHFRFIDKLFKAKNYRVKAFHALVLFMKQQGKPFKIPKKPRRQTTTNPSFGS